MSGVDVAGLAPDADNDFWQQRYAAAAASGDLVWSATPNAWIATEVERLGPPAGRTAVDLGAGEGRNALWLASLGWAVTAVDFSPAGLSIGAGRAEREGLEVRWVAADASTWHPPTAVDLVIVAYLQLPAPLLRASLAAAASYLAPGGTLALINHAVENLTDGVGGPRDASILTATDDLRTPVAGTLDIVRCGLVERVTDAGVAIDAELLARAPR